MELFQAFLGELNQGLSGDGAFWFMLGAVGLAGVIRGFTGFGSAMVMAPVFVLFLSPAESVATVLCLELIVSVQLMPNAFRNVDWRLAAPLGLGAWLTTIVGLWLVLAVDKSLMRQIIAATVLVFVVVMYRGWRFKGRPNFLTSVLVGGLSGISTAATSMGGPPVILYLLSSMENVRTFRGTIIVYFLIGTIPSLIGLGLAQALDGETLLRVAALAPAFMATAWGSSKFVQYASETFFRRFALSILALIALGVLFLE